MKKQISRNIEISRLISDYIKGQGNISDEQKIKDWLNESPEHKILLKEILSEKNREDREKIIQRINLDEEWMKLQLRTQFARKKWQTVLKYAAIFLVPLVIGSYLLFLSPFNSSPTQPVAEIEPGIKKAQLILSNGEKIELSNKDQVIVVGEDIVIDNKDQLLNYKAVSGTDVKHELVYNQLLIGIGEEYQLVLSDGTKVWLNSDSKLKYPVQFASNIREVELEGQAYFEVTENREVPFVVKTNALNVEVLGTKFDVSAYNNEQTIKTTLVNGKVKVSGTNQVDGEDVILKPNDQAVFNKSTNMVEVNVVDPEMYIGWTKGVFAFDETSLSQIMSQLSRWYGINVSYEDSVSGESRFSGKLPRFEDCNVLLEMIEKTTDIRFEVKENKNIIVGMR